MKEIVTKVIRERRSIFPPMYTGEKIDDSVIWEMLENANWAPNHRKTEPWRFVVLTDEALQELSDYAGQWYETNVTGDAYSAMKHKKVKTNPLRASHIIAICMQRDPKESVPEWEEEAAVACAVQNMWLTCTSYDLGCYWSSPKYALEADEFLELTDREKCLGLLYIGIPQSDLTFNSTRGDIKEKVRWRK